MGRNETRQAREGKRAVVIGASIAGLLAARVLSEHFQEVVLIDRDEIPQGSQGRAGVPQGLHAHAFVARGLLTLEELLPGSAQLLRSAGATWGDLQRDMEWHFGDAVLARAESGLPVLAASRPLLERVVREQVLALPEVRLVSQARVLGLLRGDVGVGGVVFSATRGKRDSGAHDLRAELVVDASGRAGHARTWLNGLGAELPEVSRVTVHVRYTSGRFRCDSSLLRGRLAIAVSGRSDHPRAGLLQQVERGEILVSLIGRHEECAPADADGFRAFASTLLAPAIAEILEHASPVSPLHRYEVRENVRAHYERLVDPTENFVVTGDALACFNPVYAQGMTCAALGATALRDCLRTGTRALARRFFARVHKLIEPAWSFGRSADRAAMPSARTALLDAAMDRWLARIVRRGCSDPQLARLFYGVTSMVDSPARLFAPRTVARALAPRRARCGRA